MAARSPLIGPFMHVATSRLFSNIWHEKFSPKSTTNGNSFQSIIEDGQDRSLLYGFLTFTSNTRQLKGVSSLHIGHRPEQAHMKLSHITFFLDKERFIT
jgi:hypothetical protein